MGVRAELRRMQKQEAKMIPVEVVSKKTNVRVEELLRWKAQVEKEICQQYQKKLERAEDLILAAMVFSSMAAVRDTWKLKLDLQKYFDNLMRERDLAFKGENNEGIKTLMKRVMDESGMQFEFDDIDLNEEFHLGEWDYNLDISQMTPNKAYDEGFDNASILGNIMNTAIFADQMLDRGFSVQDIQKLIIESNEKLRKMRIGKGKVSEFLLHLKKRGIDVGDQNIETVRKFRL